MKKALPVPSEREILKAIESATIQGRRILFPEVRIFGELFRAIQPYKGKSREVCSFPSYIKREQVQINSYCSVKDGEALDVEPNETLLNELKKQFGVPGNVSFEAVVRKDGTVLVLARYSQILASRWLAIAGLAEPCFS